MDLTRSAQAARAGLGGGIAAPLMEISGVPFYNFEVRTPSHVMVTQGAKLPDGTAARVEAAQRVGELLRVHAGQLWVDQDWQMDVTDDVGLILYVIQISASRTAATLGGS